MNLPGPNLRAHRNDSGGSPLVGLALGRMEELGIQVEDGGLEFGLLKAVFNDYLHQRARRIHSGFRILASPHYVEINPCSHLDRKSVV